MKNLKRILSLALACTMLIGMMVVGANAANFSDADDIQHTEAVETLVALGAISGNGNGAFDPEGPFTRAAMAKMLAWTMNKGKDPTFADTDNPTFSDVDTPATRWAIPYIEYCYQLGYVSGDGGKGSTFRPNDPVKSTEFARALLNAMGYKLDSFENWDLKTEVQAREENIDLYNNLEDAIAGKPMTRDDAMQMMYNALNAPLANAQVINSYVYDLTITASGKVITFDSAAEAVAYGEGKNWTAGTDYTLARRESTTTETLASKYLGLKEDPGVLLSVKWDEDDEVYYINVSGNEYAIEEDTCSNMIGENVTVLYRETKNGDEVYGVMSAGSVLYNGTVGGLTFYAAANPARAISATAYQWNNTDAAATAWAPMDKSWGIKVVRTGTDTDNVTPLYRITVTPYTLATVTNLTATTIVLSKGIGTQTIDKTIIGYEGLAKGDQVLVTPAENTVSGLIELTKAEVLEGVAANGARPATNSRDNQVRINGTWYPVATTSNYNTLAAMTAKKTYNVALVNGYIVSADEVQAAAAESDAELVVLLDFVATEETSGSFLKYREAQVYFLADGTTKIVKANMGTGNVSANYDKNALYTAELDDNGYYKFTKVATTDAEKLGYEAGVGATAVVWADGTKSAKIGGELIAENAKILVLVKDAAKSTVAGQGGATETVTIYKIVTVDAKTARAWKATGTDFQSFGTGTNSISFYNTVDGVPFIQFAFIDASGETGTPDQTGTTGNYGYVISDSYRTTSGGKVYWTYDIWTGTETISVLDKTTAPSAPLKNTLIEYQDMGDGIIDSTGTSHTLENAAVVGLSLANNVIYLMDKNGDVQGNSMKALALTNNTKTYYIDTKNSVGATSGTLALAELVNGAYAFNVKYELTNPSTSNEVAFLIVDIGGQIYGAGNVATQDTIKSLDDGIYVGGPKYVTDLSGYNSTKNAYNVFFKFSLNLADKDKNVTLTITNVALNKVAYQETLSWSTVTEDGTPKFFVINTAMTGAGDGGSDARQNTGDCYGTANADGTLPMKAGTYSVTVTVDGATEPVLKGTFTVK